MVDHDVIDDENATRVRSLDHVLQIRKRSPMRRDIVEVTPRVTVKLAALVDYHRRNPNRRCSESFDVVEFLFNAFEIPAVDGHTAAAAGIIVALGVVIRRITIEKAIRDNLINALRLPKSV